MNRYRTLLAFYALLLVTFLLVACGGASEEPDVSVPPAEEPEVQAVEPSQPNGQAAEEPVVEEAVPEEAVAQEPEPISFEPRPHRVEPAPLDAFIEDDAQYYAATGKPQLIEIFTYW